MARFLSRAAPVALFPALFLAALAQAQPDTLTLQSAVALGIERAPQLEARAAAVDAAQAESIAAGRLPDPELMLGVDNVPVDGEDAWSLDRDFMTMRSVGVMQEFPNGRKRMSQRERAGAAIRVAKTQAAETELEIARATAEAWIATHAAELVLEKLHALRPEVELQARAARSAFASGRGSSVDALAAQSAISELDDRILDARRDVQAARAGLARWIGEDAQLALAPRPALDILPARRADLLAALHEHPLLQTLDARLALAQADIDLARAEKRPDWSARLAYAERGDAFSDMISLQVRVGLPLFSRYRQDPIIRARMAERARLQADRDAELRMHTAEVTAVFAAWEAARARADLYERERLPLARERSTAALAGFRAGRLELSDALASQVAEIEAQRSYAALIGELGRAWAFLRYLDHSGTAHAAATE